MSVTPVDRNAVEVLHRLRAALPCYSYRFTTEVSLHLALAAALDAEAIPYEREVVAGPSDRFDFLVPPGIVIEAKIKGSLSAALSQCGRYAARDDVTGVLLVASRHWANGNATFESHGKRIHVIKLNGASF